MFLTSVGNKIVLPLGKILHGHIEKINVKCKRKYSYVF